MYSDQREGREGEENPLSRMSLQHHAEATAVTPDYPSVSDFERDFLGLSSHSQWSSMLHRTRHHRSRFESRYQAYQPLLPPPHPILFCPRRSVAPATRGLRRWDRPFPESSSIIELDTEPHRETSAAFSSTFSHIPRHCRFLYVSSRLLHVGCLPVHPEYELSFAALVLRLQNYIYIYIYYPLFNFLLFYLIHYSFIFFSSFFFSSILSL